MSSLPASASVPVPATPAPAAPVIARPIASPQAMLEAHKDLTEMLDKILVKDVDYGTVPGTSGGSLFKPGAERISIAFGVRPEFETVEREVDHDRPVSWMKTKKGKYDERTRSYGPSSVESGTSVGLYRHVVRCRLVRFDGVCLGESLGATSTMESKYVDRPRECENTVLKMAQKRAHVGAVIGAFGLSGRFKNGEAEKKTKPKAADAQKGAATVDSDSELVWAGSEEDVFSLHLHLEELGVPKAVWGAIEKALKGKKRGAAPAIIQQEWNSAPGVSA